MEERELDRTIDTAAKSMMAHEPSRALNYEVMARVRENVGPSPRRCVWLTAGASVIVCVAIVAALMYRLPQAIPSPPAAQPLAVAPGASIADASPKAMNVTPPVHRASAPPVVRRVGPPVVPMLVDLTPIAPLEAEPIAVSAIEVPRLEPESTWIEPLIVEPLTIEPLAASND
jgi:hypothetical protein